MPFEIRPAASLPPFEVINSVWQPAFGPGFRLTARLWQQNTLGDPGFRPADLVLAYTQGGDLAGFALTKRFRELDHYPARNLEKYERLGYIGLLAVGPAYQRQGLGRQLLETAQARLAEQGASEIRLGGSFRHFFPGWPTDCLAARPLLEAQGYRFNLARPEYDLEGPLDPAVFGPVLSAITGLTYRQGRAGDEPALLDFVGRVFPGRWWYDLRLYLAQDGPVEAVSLVEDQAGRVQGFLMTYQSDGPIVGAGVYWHAGEAGWGGIGPLGISPELRGRGAGLALVAAGMRYLHGQGARYARIDWTTLLDFYGRLGFRPVQTYWTGGKTV